LHYTPDVFFKKEPMIDTPQHVLDAENLQHEIFRAMTPGKRWEQFLSLRATAWKLKRAGLRSLYPELPDKEIEDMVREYFLHAKS
jgi:hypothetical protein